MAEEKDDLASDLFVPARERDPLRAVAEGGKPKKLARFYKSVTTAPQAEGFAVLLDGKPLRTPARAPLLLSSEALAQEVAREWEAQAEHVDPASMPLTRLANSALDGVRPRMAEVEADAAKYAASDLVCYRAGEPEGLVAAQREAWDPILAFIYERCGARFALSEGVMHHAQPRETLDAVGQLLHETVGDGKAAPFRLAGIHVMTTLSGSLVVALAVALRHLDAEAGFAAAHVDEDYQLRVWGMDAEAMARRARRSEEMRAAALCVALSGSQAP
ncbi:ATP12 family chaperone protein [Methylocystis bryophila]|uniref:ATPase n=1 Tax=Methylocystis bryophila TaxID=655015 RepID=A0A1W6MS69_9HYPH|nr:ATP12 family protein [Methylocystis bryophila]ARN80339.1 ATPase [Methylocystis bryophila]BDV40322.1 ATPase [Methylocystis bryophila]